MAATHGKLGIVYRSRPNGFVGSGLNDMSIGSFDSASDSSYFEIEIDASGTPDTFQWRENGGAWTTGVAITGAEQTLSGANGDQKITFSATTGHSVGDKWVTGSLYQEPTTESGMTAQITDSTMRILNPNATPTFTDSGGANVIRVDHMEGKAYFDDTVAVVTVTGDNGFIPSAGLGKVGYLYNWSFDITADLAEISAFQDNWKDFIAGQSGLTGMAEGYFFNNDWFDDVKAKISASEEYSLLQLFTYDPDDDQTGDHFNLAVLFSGYTLAAPMTDVVKETINFSAAGMVDFIANS